MVFSWGCKEIAPSKEKKRALKRLYKSDVIYSKYKEIPIESF
jgi:uncharacterized protein YktA (UPF0223 family)